MQTHARVLRLNLETVKKPTLKKLQMIPISDFIKEIETEIEEIEPGTLKPETDYRKLESWSSMHALIILAMIDTNHDITLTGEELRTCITIQNLYDLVKSKKG